MKSKENIIIYLLLVTVIFSGYSCKKKSSDKPFLGFGYFPVEKGNFIIYQLDSFYYNDFTGGIDTFRFEVKEKISDVFLDAENRNTARIERFYRKSNSDEWVIQDVWTANLTPSTAEKTEENQRFVKLTFPLKSNSVWDGNRFNTQGNQNYKVEKIHQSMTLNSIPFDSVAMILQKADSNLIRKDWSREIYANKIGLVYKRFISVEDRDSIVDYTKPLNQRVDFGFDYTYTYLSHGKD